MYKRLRTKDPSFRWTNVCKVNSLFNCVDIVNNFLLQITFETKNNVPNLLSEAKLGSSRCNRQNSHSEGGIFINFELSKGIVDLSLFFCLEASRVRHLLAYWKTFIGHAYFLFFRSTDPPNIRCDQLCAISELAVSKAKTI